MDSRKRDGALNAVRHIQFGGRLREVRYEVVFVVQPRKLVQKVADINFISSQMTADGVCVNRESHARIYSIAAYLGEMP